MPGADSVYSVAAAAVALHKSSGLAGWNRYLRAHVFKKVANPSDVYTSCIVRKQPSWPAQEGGSHVQEAAGTYRKLGGRQAPEPQHNLHSTIAMPAQLLQSSTISASLKAAQMPL
jgi:hypothetical protein